MKPTIESLEELKKIASYNNPDLQSQVGKTLLLIIKTLVELEEKINETHD